jgi:hypothetical protein
MTAQRARTVPDASGLHFAAAAAKALAPAQPRGLWQ